MYYPSGSDIIALNTSTREREILTTISFSPRCLTASKEWLCCGGEKGHYASICLTDRVPTPGRSSSRDAGADARLALDLDPSHRSNPRGPMSIFGRSRHTRTATANTSKVGSEIVNCITLWSPTENTSDRTYKVPVVVVSNNDRTVSVLNVQTTEVIQTLTMPDFVNRSVMSPDGELLITICDDPYLYVHERNAKLDAEKGRFDSRHRAEHEWVFSKRIQLEGQREADKSNMRGSFATSFSKSGKYLAVATQYGIISVFDVESLTRLESPVVVFTSSRPHCNDGAVRAMEFSPGPFDLLAWTEQSGRVGVADMRTLFMSRQLIRIDPHAEGVERVHIADKLTDPIIDPRLRSFRTESPSTGSTPDYLGLDFERRQLRHLTREMLDRHQAPLTAEELEVLQAHRIARRQRDAANAAREALAEASSPRGWGFLAEGQRSSNTGERALNDDRRISTSGLPAALREFVNPDRMAASIGSVIDEPDRESERRNQMAHEPRRRSSFTLAAAENAAERETIGPGTSRNETSSGLERLTLTPSRVGSDSPNNTWAEIDALYRTRFPPETSISRSARLRIEVEDDDRREFAQRLRQPYWRPLDELSQMGLATREENSVLRGVLRPGSTHTMGCCWSEDGKIL